ncbi:MAG TPA: hypothetical protein VIM89_23235 [Mucilaginibacter sp.]
MDERITAFRREAEIIEKRFEKLFNGRPGFSPEKPDSIHNHYVLYVSDDDVLLVFPARNILTPVPMQQLKEVYHRIFGK